MPCERMPPSTDATHDLTPSLSVAATKPAPHVSHFAYRCPTRKRTVHPGHSQAQPDSFWTSFSPSGHRLLQLFVDSSQTAPSQRQAVPRSSGADPYARRKQSRDPREREIIRRCYRCSHARRHTNISLAQRGRKRQPTMGHAAQALYLPVEATHAACSFPPVHLHHLPSSAASAIPAGHRQAPVPAS
jgi:hypothetical protein